MILLDTDVMVDYLRGFKPARDWLEAADTQEIGLPGLVGMELLQGCQNSREQNRIEKALRSYVIFWPDSNHCERAMENFAAYHLNHQLGLLDVLIAETAICHNAELATFNKKHYGMIKELKMIQPYKR
jgi:predicted nucleic acid-binding protein